MMADWPYRFKVKDLLSGEDVPPDRAKALATEIVGRLQRSAAFPPGVQHGLIDVFEEVEDQDSFNSALDELYDFADQERVWCE